MTLLRCRLLTMLREECDDNHKSVMNRGIMW